MNSCSSLDLRIHSFDKGPEASLDTSHHHPSSLFTTLRDHRGTPIESKALSVFTIPPDHLILPHQSRQTQLVCHLEITTLFDTFDDDVEPCWNDRRGSQRYTTVTAVTW